MVLVVTRSLCVSLISKWCNPRLQEYSLRLGSSTKTCNTLPVDASFGLAKTLVSGIVFADLYRIVKNSEIISRKIDIFWNKPIHLISRRVTVNFAKDPTATKLLGLVAITNPSKELKFNYFFLRESSVLCIFASISLRKSFHFSPYL